MKKSLHLENWQFPLYVKRIDVQEYQVLVLMNKRRDASFEVLDLRNRSSDSVVKVTTADLYEYNLRKNAKVINVNTGSSNEIVIYKCSKENWKNNNSLADKIPILDRVLNGKSNVSLKIEYLFICELVINYK